MPKNLSSIWQSMAIAIWLEWRRVAVLQGWRWNLLQAARSWNHRLMKPRFFKLLQYLAYNHMFHKKREAIVGNQIWLQYVLTSYNSCHLNHLSPSLFLAVIGELAKLVMHTHTHIQYHLYLMSSHTKAPLMVRWSITTRNEGENSKVWKPQRSFAASPPNSHAPAVEQEKWVGLGELLLKQQVLGFKSIFMFSWLYGYMMCVSRVSMVSFFGSYRFRSLGTTNPSWTLRPLGRLPPPSSAPHCPVPCPLYFPNLKVKKM